MEPLGVAEARQLTAGRVSRPQRQVALAAHVLGWWSAALLLNVTIGLTVDGTWNSGGKIALRAIAYLAPLAASVACAVLAKRGSGVASALNCILLLLWAGAFIWMTFALLLFPGPSGTLPQALGAPAFAFFFGYVAFRAGAALLGGRQGA